MGLVEWQAQSYMTVSIITEGTTKGARTVLEEGEEEAAVVLWQAQARCDEEH